jgi:hypothetical protein
MRTQVHAERDMPALHGVGRHLRAALDVRRRRHIADVRFYRLLSEMERRRGRREMTSPGFRRP